jgi:hypothetical protein
MATIRELCACGHSLADGVGPHNPLNRTCPVIGCYCTDARHGRETAGSGLEHKE